MPELIRLFFGTVVLRPYVFLFLLIYLMAAIGHLGWRRTAVYTPLGYLVAFLSELSSIHWGFPYGDYYYIENTIHQELWVFGVPFMDSLSYVFLSYCSYSMALFLLSPVAVTTRGLFILESRRLRRSWQTLILASLLFVLLDLIIDPVALQGHRWFLGQIYGYRQVGLYFGIPMSNFGGWLLVGFAMTGVLQLLDSVGFLEPGAKAGRTPVPEALVLGPLLYVSVLAFNLAVTFWIGETLLGLVGCLILFFPALLALFFTLYKRAHLTVEQIEEHSRDFPLSKAVRLLDLRRPEAVSQHQVF